jgi:uncharacterized protein
MKSPHQDFASRLSKIPEHGLGLSVDVYAPDLFELAQSLEAAGVSYDYLEIFRAPESALETVRRAFPGLPLAYHGEGLWMTQPDWDAAYPAEDEMSVAATHLAALGASWINHECASKQLAGYSFGTYLPPLFTEAGARVTARHARWLQDRLDRSESFAADAVPLVLLEIPPLTYFAFGDLSVPAFFRRLIDEAPCGVVLDIGHVWTIYRYSMEWRRCDLATFLSAFLDEFPLERVVQIHLAGLGEHERTRPTPGSFAPARPEPVISPVDFTRPAPATISPNHPELAKTNSCPVGRAVSRGRAGQNQLFSRGTGSFPGASPLWIDAHAELIPDLLLEMLDQVLAHPRLTALRGVALEVDTKDIRRIVEECESVRDRFGARIEARTHAGDPMGAGDVGTERSFPDVVDDGRDDGPLLRQYRLYAETVSREDVAIPDALPAPWVDPDGLRQYRREYLPHEILRWGGDLEDMFPSTCRALQAQGISQKAFVAYWVREPRRVVQAYDFFLLKVDGFVDFIAEALPSSLETARREAKELRAAYQAACVQTGEIRVAGVTGGGGR